MSCLKACKLPRCPASHLRGLTRKKTVRHADSTGARRKEPPNLASHPCAPHPAILHVFLLESVRNSLAGVLAGHTALGALWALQVLSSENRPSHSKLPSGEVARICIKGTWDDQVFFLISLTFLQSGVCETFPSPLLSTWKQLQEAIFALPDGSIPRLRGGGSLRCGRFTSFSCLWC